VIVFTRKPFSCKWRLRKCTCLHNSTNILIVKVDKLAMCRYYLLRRLGLHTQVSNG